MNILLNSIKSFFKPLSFVHTLQQSMYRIFIFNNYIKNEEIGVSGFYSLMMSSYKHNIFKHSYCRVSIYIQVHY